MKLMNNLYYKNNKMKILKLQISIKNNINQKQKINYKMK